MADLRPAALSVGAVVLIAMVGWAAYSTNLLRTRPARAETPAIATGTALVVRTNVRQRTPVTGTLGFAGSYSVIAPPGSAAATSPDGTPNVITWLPAVGATVTRGQPAYATNGQPVPLFYGARPAWRALGPGVTRGPDVRQLQRNLIALGYASGLGLAADGQFGWATELAVERWEQAAGFQVTGTVALGQVVYLPGPLLVSQQLAMVGGPVPAGTPILEGSSTTTDVQIALDPTLAPAVHRGNRVVVTLPDGTPDPGVITEVSRVAQTPSGTQGQQYSQGGEQPPTVPVTVRLLRLVRGALDQAQVQVAITSAEDRGVLAVPVTALLAEPGGRFVVVIVSTAAGRSQRHTVPVRTGLFDEIAGVVEVSGPGLAAGQHVAVPAR